MKPYFFDLNNIIRLEKIIKKWEGTRFCHLNSICQGGVDCAHLVGCIFLELGVIDKIEKRYYSRDWFMHTQEEFMINIFKEHIKKTKYQYKKIDFDNRKYGDIVFISLRSDIAHHVGLYLSDDRFFHAFEKKGAHIDQYSRFWQVRTRYIYRIYEE